MCTGVNPSAPFRPSPDGRWEALANRSRHLLRDTQHSGGAWPASPDFGPYGYSWFRDGSFIAEGASAAGLTDEATRFHHWCASVLVRERSAVSRVFAALDEGVEVADSDYLPARYNLDGSRHQDDWWNFQVDGYGTWLWALERHLARTGGSPDAFGDAIEVAVRYLLATGRRTCRDWWEENRDQVHVTTLAGVAAGLRAAVRMGSLPGDLAGSASSVADAAVADIHRDGVRDGHLVKWLGGHDVDASLLAVAALYDVVPVDDPLAVNTARAVESQLVDGGVHRYLGDSFYGGGQWPVLACLLAWHHARSGDHARAAELLDWTASVADDELRLPEQAPPLLAPQVLDEWLDRWGPSAHPLVWSHGMFLAAVSASSQAVADEVRYGVSSPASSA